VLIHKCKLTVWRAIFWCYLFQVIFQCAVGKYSVCGRVEFPLSFVGCVGISSTAVSASSCSRLSLNWLTSEIHLRDASQIITKSSLQRTAILCFDGNRRWSSWNWPTEPPVWVEYLSLPVDLRITGSSCVGWTDGRPSRQEILSIFYDIWRSLVQPQEHLCPQKV